MEDGPGKRIKFHGVGDTLEINLQVEVVYEMKVRDTRKIQIQGDCLQKSFANPPLYSLNGIALRRVIVKQKLITPIFYLTLIYVYKFMI